MAKKVVRKAPVAPTCNTNSCKHWGICVLVLGILILLNGLLSVVTWSVFIGIIAIVKGLILLIWHPKACCC